MIDDPRDEDVDGAFDREFDRRTEDWIDGHLSPADRDAFEAELEADETLRAMAYARRDEVRDLQRALGGMAADGPGSTRDFATARPGDVSVTGGGFAERVAEIAAATPQDSTGPGLRALPASTAMGWAPWIASAAAAAVLAGVTWWVWTLDPARVEMDTSASAGSGSSKDEDAVETMNRLRKGGATVDPGSSPPAEGPKAHGTRSAPRPGGIGFFERGEAAVEGRGSKVQNELSGEIPGSAPEVLLDRPANDDSVPSKAAVGTPAREFSEAELQQLKANHRSAPSPRIDPKQAGPGAAAGIRERSLPGAPPTLNDPKPSGATTLKEAKPGGAVPLRRESADAPGESAGTDPGEGDSRRRSPRSVSRDAEEGVAEEGVASAADSLSDSLEQPEAAVNFVARFSQFEAQQLEVGGEQPVTALVVDLDATALQAGLKLRGTKAEDTPLGSRAGRARGASAELWNGLAQWSLKPVVTAAPHQALGADLTVTPLWPVTANPANRDATTADPKAIPSSVFFDGSRYAVRLDAIQPPDLDPASRVLRAMRVVGPEAKVADLALSLGAWVDVTAGAEELDAAVIRQVVVQAIRDQGVDGARTELPAANGWAELPEGQSDLLLVFRKLVPPAPAKPANAPKKSGDG